MRVGYLNQHFNSAISFGALSIDALSIPEDALINKITMSVVPDVLIDGQLDSGLVLCSLIKDNVKGEVDSNLDLGITGLNVDGIKLGILSQFESSHSRFKQGPAEFKALFQLQISNKIERRCNRVEEWVTSWLTDTNGNAFPEEAEVRILLWTTRNKLRDLANKWKVCGLQCSKCFHLCLCEHGHDGEEHTCYSNHLCQMKCTYCSDAEEEYSPLCSLPSGHEGKHFCTTKEHICGESCYLTNLGNCMKKCTKEPGHEGMHQCPSSRHLCESKCSLTNCQNYCQMAYDVNHSQHRCEELMCPEECMMLNCTRKCSSCDHFHAMAESSPYHICKDTHPCAELCEEEGVCRIDSQLLRVKKTFERKLSKFEYDHQVEQNGHRDVCCIVIPVGETVHRGKHIHTESSNAVHYCESRCDTCGYYCTNHFGHQSLHECRHGNMTRGDCELLATADEFLVGNRKYCRGESSKAEMCDMLCRTLGRGHVHLQKCKCLPSRPYSQLGLQLDQNLSSLIVCEPCTPTRKHVLNPFQSYDVEENLDEITHDEYWKDVGWADPCSVEEQGLFRKCGVKCGISCHEITTDEMQSEEFDSSHYCMLDLFHPFLTQSSPRPSENGFISIQGHFYTCSKDSPGGSYHVIFVVDMSGSMSLADAQPADKRITPSNRLGCALEACDRFVSMRCISGAADIVSLVLFSTFADVAFEQRPVAPTLIREHVQSGYCYSHGGTYFSAGLEVTQQLVMRTANSLPILVMFLTDGHDGNKRGMKDSVQNLSSIRSDILFRAIAFGRDCDSAYLNSMAEFMGADRGRLINAVDEVELTKCFEEQAKELSIRVSVLQRKHLSVA